MTNEHQKSLCDFHRGIAEDPIVCRTGCAGSESLKRSAAGMARLQPHLDLADTIAAKAAEIKTIVGADPWGTRPAQEFAVKIGSTYKTRSGEIVGPLFVSSVSNGLVGIIGGLRVCWNPDGTKVGADEYPHPFDLVAEIRDTDGTAYPICPHCGREERDACEFNFGPSLDGEAVITCGYCDREYDTVRNVSVTYTTKVTKNA